ncbi:ABC transporter permease [Bacillus massiliigorillae]|uniref:ABC transporter permease n=1 Tax=Bacillus massiliigorillae TaxID=1243664 RepID=UPI00039C5F91|nr:ABC transporter permease [Bacillus massiliigorillae]
MLFHLIKKDILVLIRNRSMLVQLLLMPTVLICILGFALSGMMGGDQAVLKAKVYMVNHGLEKKELQQFINEVDTSTVLPPEAKVQIKEAATTVLPISMLQDQVLASKEVKKSIHVKNALPSELKELKKGDKATVIVEIPEGFTYDFLQHMFFQKGEAPTLKVLSNEADPLSSNMFKGILDSFQEQYAFSNLLQQEKLPVNLNDQPLIKISKETVDQTPIISSAAYYTVGMGMMFIYFIVSNLAAFAYQEKDLHMYSRIVLSNVSPWSYLSSYFISGMLLAFIQICILFGTSVLLYDVQIPSLPLFALITFCVCLGVGGFTAFITAITLKFKNENVPNFFSAIINFFCFFGGSFVPISTFPEWMQNVGSYTLNGAGLMAFTNMMQEYDISYFSSHLWTMVAYSVILLILAFVFFPRRGEA